MEFNMVEAFIDRTVRSEDARRINELERMAFIDSLTGLANRRYVETAISARFDEMRRYGWTFGILFMGSTIVRITI